MIRFRPGQSTMSRYCCVPEDAFFRVEFDGSDDGSAFVGRGDTVTRSSDENIMCGYRG